MKVGQQVMLTPRFSGERQILNQTAGIVDANCGQTEPPPDRETVDAGMQTDFDTGYSSGTHSQSDLNREPIQMTQKIW